jgi:transcriptional regulator with PAS, ATPase and Fis domain
MHDRDPGGGQPTLTTLRSDAVEVPHLELTVSPLAGPVVKVKLEVMALVLGTSGECDVVIADPSVSRRHCKIALTERGVMIRDLGSKNGTFVEGVQVVEAWLHPGKKATLGDSTITLGVAGPPSLVPISQSARFGEALGSSIPMRALFAKLERAAATVETILLLGESGTGKELLARGIHDASARSGGPFVVFDCGAVAPNLLEAELFGYLRGAFTGADHPRAGLFEQASGGTLFIDEIGELPLEMQPKLLRALEARQFRRLGAGKDTKFDARVVAATHRDLLSSVSGGTFRQDLYYRLAVVEAIVPPLRERKEDIPLLVQRFLASQSPPRSLVDLPPNAIELLRGHSWPGNVRELRNTVARLVLFPYLGEQAITRSSERTEEAAVAKVTALPLREARGVMLEHFERTYLTAKLREHSGNVTRAADAMGVSRQFVHRLLERYGLRSGD